MVKPDKMEKEPLRYLKKIVKIGLTSYVSIPQEWLKKFQKIKKVIMEIYDNKIIISPNQEIHR